MERMSEGRSGSREGESWQRSRETRPAVENMSSVERARIIEDIAYLLAWLIEVGPGADPDVKRARRAAFQAALAQLDIDINKPRWGDLFGEAIRQIAWEKEHPPKPPHYPPLGKFQQVLNQLIRQKHPLLADLEGRDGMELSLYLYGLGLIMASELSYGYIFPESDPIRWNRRTNEVEGRHRFLTLYVLDKLGFDTRRWRWVNIESSR